jgi:Family of unknown function (DUF5706)
MAKEVDGQDAGAAEASGVGIDPAAMALALDATNIDPSIAEDAWAYMRKQGALADIQMHHLGEEKNPSYQATMSEYLVVERHVLQDNIILCDTKCGILLAFSALIIEWCLDKVLTLSGYNVAGLPLVFARIEMVLYAFAVLSLFVTIGFTWRVIRPRLRTTDDHIFWGAKFFNQSEEAFMQTIQNVKGEVLGKDMLRHLHVLAGICRDKFQNFRCAAIAAEFSTGFVLLAVSAELAEKFIRPI